MEEVCQEVKSGKTDRKFYQDKLVQINNLGRKEWVGCEHPLLLAIQVGKVEIVDLFIHMGIHVNSVKRNQDNTTLTPLNESLRQGREDIVELLLKRGASLNLPEKGDNGNDILPMEVAKDDSVLHNTLMRFVRRSSLTSSYFIDPKK